MSFLLLTVPCLKAQEELRVLPIFDKVIFYDGYAPTVADQTGKEGSIRLNNYRFAHRFTPSELDWPGEDLRMRVTIGARCDNYDRTGCVSLALVPKGAESYVPEEVERIELGRFITPFMNKNRMPDRVDYNYNVPGLSRIMHDSSLREEYDLWIELEVFGIPYSANEQIKGCELRSDVFQGSLELTSVSEAALANDDNVLVPIVMKKTEIHGPKNFNSYTEGACDVPGKPEKTYSFSLEEDLNDARLIIITTSHGATENGEEYFRRHHFFFLNDEPLYDYIPGGESCEPYRKYNTQPNGIYGYEPDYDFWYNNSNWCPGQAVPVRDVHIGPMKAGHHNLRLSVPDAEFYGDRGDIYVSAFLLGSKSGLVPSGAPSVTKEPEIGIHIEGNTLSLDGGKDVREVSLYSLKGELLYGKHNPGECLELEGFTPGIYLVAAVTSAGQSVFKKIVLK